MTDVTTAQKDRLISDLKVVIADAEALLQSTAGNVGEGMSEARSRIEASLKQARENLLDLQDAAAARAKAAGRAADDYVHEHPWTSIGVAAGLGLVVGLLIGRR